MFASRFVQGVSSAVGLVCGVGGFLFPPLWIGSVISGVVGLSSLAFVPWIRSVIESIKEPSAKAHDAVNKLTIIWNEYLKNIQCIQNTFGSTNATIRKWALIYEILKRKFPHLSPCQRLNELKHDLTETNTTEPGDKEQKCSPLSDSFTENVTQKLGYQVAGLTRAVTTILHPDALISFGKVSKALFGRGTLSKFFGRGANVVGNTTKLLPAIGIIFDGITLITSIKDLTKDHPACVQLMDAMSALDEQSKDFQKLLDSCKQFIQIAEELYKQS